MRKALSRCTNAVSAAAGRFTAPPQSPVNCTTPTPPGGTADAYRRTAARTASTAASGIPAAGQKSERAA